MLGVEAHIWLRMQDSDFREQVSEVCQEAFPGPAAPLAASPKLAQQPAHRLFPKRDQSRFDSRYGMVAKVSPHHGLQPFCRFRQRVLHPPSQLGLHLLQLPRHTFADGLSDYGVVASLTAPHLNVRETPEITYIWS